MRYLALADGFIGSHYVCAGEEFEFDGRTPSWARPLENLSAATEPEASSVVIDIQKPKRRVIHRKPKAKAEEKLETI